MKHVFGLAAKVLIYIGEAGIGTDLTKLCESL